MNFFGARETSKSEFYISCGGIFLLGASLLAPWLRGRVGSTVERASGWSLISARVFVIILIVGAIASAIAVAKSNSEFARCAQAAMAIIALVVPIFVIIVAEVSVVWLAPDLLPHSLRRFSVGVGPGWGLWILMLGGVLLLVSALGKSAESLIILRQTGRKALKLDIAAVGLALTTAAIPLLIASRYASWLHVASPAGDADLPGWALPWAGPVSAVLCVVLVAGAVAMLLTKSSGVAIAMVILGWVVSATAAVVLILGSLPKIAAPEWIGRAITNFGERETQSGVVGSVTRSLTSKFDPGSLKFDLSRGWGAYLAFSAGLLLMAACSLIARARLGNTPIQED